jgi:hypothetical protein
MSARAVYSVTLLNAYKTIVVASDERLSLSRLKYSKIPFD